MSAELWGSRAKLKWVMNRAIFQGIAAAEASGASRQKALKRHTGKGRGVGPGCHQGGVHSSSHSSASEGKHFAACQRSFYPVPAATGTASRPAGSTKHHWPAAPSSTLLCLCSLKWGIFYWRPPWAGGATINYSKKLPPGPGWEGRGLRAKQVTSKRIKRKRGLGASLFPQPVTLTAMHPLIWEEVWWDGRCGCGRCSGGPCRVCNARSGHRCQHVGPRGGCTAAMGEGGSLRSSQS